jgi:hypothetical protein
MDKKQFDIFFYIAAGLLIVGILYTGANKFLLKKPIVDSFRIDSIDSIAITDLEKRRIQLNDLFSAEGVHYILLFGLADCPPCIYQGFQELAELEKAGRDCFGLVVHNIIDEVGGWSSSNTVNTIYMLDKVSFYENFHCASTPVLIKIKNRKVEHYRYIHP